MSAASSPYAPRAGLIGGHLQTILPALLDRPAPLPYRRERWTTPDGDFIDIDRIDAATPNAPLLAVFHGLESNSRARYALRLGHEAAALGWSCAVIHFRGCSGELNRAPRFYHSGDSEEIDWVLRRLGATTNGALYACGISLGGNALLKWLGERGTDASRIVNSAAAVSAPLDVSVGGHALSSGLNMIYTRMFLKSLKAKCLLKLRQFPNLFDRDTMLNARDLYAFDNVVTAPLHGFRDTDDYWSRASSKPLLAGITTPTLVLNARNDPFLPEAGLPQKDQVGRAVLLEFPHGGGHVGFVAAGADGAAWMPRRVLRFLTNGS